MTLQGRIFIDRDPQHFGLILNFLRDGTCVLPTDVDARRQILQEADFYQLESLRAFIMHEDRRDLQTAQDLRACIATRLEVPLSCCCPGPDKDAALAGCGNLWLQQLCCGT